MEDRIDRLINLDIGGRGVEKLYPVARDIVGAPLAMAAARRLSGFESGDIVLFTTGSVSRAWVSPNIGENDGPIGTAVLARTLQRAFGVVPVVTAEATLQRGICAVLQAAGFSVVSLEEAQRASQPGGKIAVAVFLPFPTDDGEAEAAAGPLLDRLQPRAAVAIERAGRNSLGVYHNMRGVDFGMGRARTDLLFEEAQSRNIPLMAVGDGGNEIGMGMVTEAVRKFVPYGRTCQCPCGGGIAARTSADVLVTAAVSNWGCYAIADCIAVLRKDPRLLHSVQLEKQLLLASVHGGLINAGEGVVDTGVDGLPMEVHIAVVQLLHVMASKAMA